MAQYKVVLGIGNPGDKYRETRHNLGFKVVDRLAEHFNIKFESSQFQALVARAKRQDFDVFLMKPLTYVNNSGVSAQGILRFYNIPTDALLVIVDDLALPVGKLRFREKGSSGGHNGLDSIFRHLGTQEIPRLRIGIGRNSLIEMSSFVLSRFSNEEQEIINSAVVAAREETLKWLES